MTASLVVTVIGADRPGIVNQLSDVARRFGANWAGSRMASLAGQFAGIVHFEIAEREADALEGALRGLASSSGLQVAIARGEAPAVGGAERRIRLSLVGNDRPGIVRELSGALARRSVSIDELHTAIESAPMSAERLFRFDALISVPASVADDDLRCELEALANELMVDLDVAAPGEK
jgi:glycine cleavage system regulatory protein